MACGCNKNKGNGACVGENCPSKKEFIMSDVPKIQKTSGILPSGIYTKISAEPQITESKQPEFKDREVKETSSKLFTFTVIKAVSVQFCPGLTISIASYIPGAGYV